MGKKESLTQYQKLYLEGSIPYGEYETKLLTTSCISVIYDNIIYLKNQNYVYDENKILEYIYNLLVNDKILLNDYRWLIEILKISSQNEMHKTIINKLFSYYDFWPYLLDYLVSFIEKINVPEELITSLKNNPDFIFMYENFNLDFKGNNKEGYAYSFNASKYVMTSKFNIYEFKKLLSMEEAVVALISDGSITDVLFFLNILEHRGNDKVKFEVMKNWIKTGNTLAYTLYQENLFKDGKGFDTDYVYHQELMKSYEEGLTKKLTL